MDCFKMQSEVVLLVDSVHYISIDLAVTADALSPSYELKTLVYCFCGALCI